MALPKMIAALDAKLESQDAKLDRILAILEPEIFPISQAPQPLDPETVAQATDYNTYSAKEIIDRLGSLSKDERAALHVYESSHEKRTSVLKALAA